MLRPFQPIHPSIDPSAPVPVRTVLLNTAYTADREGSITSTAQTVVPSAEQPLFKVAGVTGTGVQSVSTPFVYANQDPPPKRNIGVPRKIYAKITTAGTYRIIIRATESVAMG